MSPPGGRSSARVSAGAGCDRPPESATRSGVRSTTTRAELTGSGCPSGRAPGGLGGCVSAAAGGAHDGPRRATRFVLSLVTTALHPLTSHVTQRPARVSGRRGRGTTSRLRSWPAPHRGRGRGHHKDTHGRRPPSIPARNRPIQGPLRRHMRTPSGHVEAPQKTRATFSYRGRRPRRLQGTRYPTTMSCDWAHTHHRTPARAQSRVNAPGPLDVRQRGVSSPTRLHLLRDTPPVPRAGRPLR